MRACAAVGPPAFLIDFLRVKGLAPCSPSYPIVLAVAMGALTLSHQEAFLLLALGVPPLLFLGDDNIKMPACGQQILVTKPALCIEGAPR